MQFLRPAFSQALPIKPMVNVGACLDIPTGTYVRGRYGEHILNAGVAGMTGVVGLGNHFKSTIMNYMIMMVLARFRRSSGSSYDTEMNIHEDRLRHIISLVQELDNEDLIETCRWIITDKTQHTGDEYFEILKQFLNEKIANKAKIPCVTPFLDRGGKSHLVIPMPTVGSVDSFTEFTTKDVLAMQEENELGDSGANTVYMQQGRQKKRFLGELTGLAGGAMHYMFLTAHLGAVFNLNPKMPNQKKLQYLHQDTKIKGAPENFSFLMNNCWHTSKAQLLINQTTKAPEFPTNSEENQESGSTDLNVVTLVQLRGKAGPSGFLVYIVVSQKDGVHPYLTEFYNIKESDKYGISGSNTNYHLDLLPDVNLSRTTVRGKLETDKRLQRAVNITSEMCQIKRYYSDADEWLCTPKELYDDIKALGYDWEVLLATRPWWTEDNDKHPVPFLSTKDLCMMRLQKYVPYWMTDDQVPASCKHISREKAF